jgi:hypothetical protein
LSNACGCSVSALTLLDFQKLLPRAEKELAALPVGIQDQIISKFELLRDFSAMGPAMFDAFTGYRALLAAKSDHRTLAQCGTG